MDFNVQIIFKSGARRHTCEHIGMHGREHSMQCVLCVANACALHVRATTTSNDRRRTKHNDDDDGDDDDDDDDAQHVVRVAE